MIFTDEDLKNLKEVLNRSVSHSRFDWLDIIERMEAAEAYCEIIGKPSMNLIDEYRLWKNWKESKGDK